jgi:predicted amidohydrolase YtcJ
MTGFLLRRVRLVNIDGTAHSTEPVDVRVTDGVVTAVGADLPDERLQEIDADGRWLSPGLWDQHVHLGQWSLSSGRLDLAPARSAAQSVNLVRERLAEWPDRPVIGWGHRPTGWSEQPVVSMLDALDSDQPVILIAGDGHHAWLNTRALMHAPPAGARGGWWRETEWFRAYGAARLAGRRRRHRSPDAYRRAMEQAAQVGVVGLTDFEFGGGREEWAERWSAGAATCCGSGWATYADGLDEVIAAGLRTGDPLPGCDERATMGPLKIISDGSLNTATAWCCEPYADAHRRVPRRPAQPLRRRAPRPARRPRPRPGGRHPRDRRRARSPRRSTAYAETGARGSIEHAQLVGRDDVRRMAELGVRASVQPAHLLDDRDVTERLWPGGRSAASRSAGCWTTACELALGSDAPVSPLDPWLAMAAAVHRSADDREAWHPEQALTPREALAASTDGWGTVAVGHPADLALLDADPLAWS